jgi:DNA polymerase III epsilon subunit family exonuclease
VKSGGLQRKLFWGVLAIFVTPTLVLEVVLMTLYRRGAFQDPWALLLGVLVGFAALMGYLGWVAHSLGRSLVRTVEAVRHGTELMATVNPDHRLEVRTGDELEALANDVNQLADALREARFELETRIAAATTGLVAERQRLTAILGELAEGVVVASLDGRVTLANRVAQELLNAGRPVLGQSLFEFVDQERMVPVLARLRAGGSAERFMVRLNGQSELHAAMTTLVDNDKRLTGFILALRTPAEPARGSAENLADPPTLVAPRFVGAGVKSGVAADTPAPNRPELYDFSVFDEMERHVPATMRERRLDQLTFVVLDTETTGLRPEGGDRIISLAGVRVRSGMVRQSEVFDALVCPERPIPPSSTRLHGITDDMVVSAPAIGVVLPAFLRFCEGTVLAGHEVSFDLGFFSGDMKRLGLPRVTLEHPVLDTRLLSRLVHGADADHTIEAVAQRLGVSIIGRHSALGDALTTAEILVRLLELLKRRGLATFGQILDALRRAGPGG